MMRFDRWFPLLVLFGVMIVLVLLIRGPVMMERSGGLGEDLITFLMLAIHIVWIFSLGGGERRGQGCSARKVVQRLARGSELLMVPTLILFLFSMIYASNANMSYAQWFAETSGNLRLAPDSTIQRFNAVLRFLPLLLIDLTAFIAARTGRRGRLGRRSWTGRRGRMITSAPIIRWSVLLSFASAALVTLTLPSPLFLKGFPLLAWVAPIPLLLVLSQASFLRAWFCGISYGALQALLGNYWLGTYDLLSLHFVTVYHGAIYALFIPVLLITSRAFPGKMGLRLRLPLMALIWVGFDYIRSGGFLGYPWGILGVSQYQNLPLIQSASLFGVWGVDFHLWLGAALLASLLLALLRSDPAGTGSLRIINLFMQLFRRRREEIFFLFALWILVPLWGYSILEGQKGRDAASTITVALIQQNTDPRKNDYAETLDRLKVLSLRAVKGEAGLSRKELPEKSVELRKSARQPDLVAWPETAFVPNLRKWGAMEPHQHPNAALARDFLDFQRELGVWLLTGNDDYEEIEEADGGIRWNHYNASVLFSDQGERVDTYRKIHMVPFSEYFPYKEELPLLYKLITAFDANLWEAGDSPVIFHHPRGSFITPICFEDSFPGEIAEQVNLGADFILNISNDFWSRTETEGQQHGANAVFRAVESRRPMVRATASGLTCVISPTGEIITQLPHYTPGYIVADVELYEGEETFYLRYIDLLPRIIIGISWLLLGVAIIRLAIALGQRFFSKRSRLS